MDAAYTLFNGPPSVDDYLALRQQSGLRPKTNEQASAGINGAWHAVHVRLGAAGPVVGMGRVISDGGWYFHIIDMATLPEHQGRGIGSAVMERLLEAIEQGAPPGAFISLLADPPGLPLYEKFSFTNTRSLGMARRTTTQT